MCVCGLDLQSCSWVKDGEPCWVLGQLGEASGPKPWEFSHSLPYPVYPTAVNLRTRAIQNQARPEPGPSRTRPIQNQAHPETCRPIQNWGPRCASQATKKGFILIKKLYLLQLVGTEITFLWNTATNIVTRLKLQNNCSNMPVI